MRDLKNNVVDKIYLCDSYMLKINEQGNLYLSRGGKKKYFLNDNIVEKYFLKKISFLRSVDNGVLHDMKDILTTLLKNKKLGNKTRDYLNRLDELLDQVL